MRVALASQNRVGNRCASRPQNIANDFGEFEVHLLHRLLDAWDVLGGTLSEHLAMSHAAAYDNYLTFRPKRSGEQSESVPGLNPLADQHNGLATKFLDLTRLDQDHLNVASLKHFEQRGPIQTRRLQRDGLNSAFRKLISRPRAIVD